MQKMCLFLWVSRFLSLPKPSLNTYQNTELGSIAPCVSSQDVIRPHVCEDDRAESSQDTEVSPLYSPLTGSAPVPGCRRLARVLQYMTQIQEVE